MDIQDNLILKIATIDELKEKWDYEIKNHKGNIHYLQAANEAIRETKHGNRITYIAKLNNQIISDITVIIKEKGILSESKYTEDLISNIRVFLCDIRTIEDYQGKGYLSKLYKYVENDLKEKGYKEISLSYDTNNIKNKIMYTKWNYTNFIRSETRTSNNTTYTYDYYYKKIDILN